MAVSLVVEHISPWQVGWDALVAGGTIGLAIFTAWLAWTTRSLARQTSSEVEHTALLAQASQHQVKSSQEQARIAQDALAAAREQTQISLLTLNAQIRPVLVDVPPEPPYRAGDDMIHYPRRDPVKGGRIGAVQVRSSPEELLISVPFVNAGVGLAMIRGVGLRHRASVPDPPATIRPTNVLPRGFGRVSFRATPHDACFAPLCEMVERAQDFSIEVAYSDLAGRETTISRFDIYFRAEASGQWEVRQMHLQAPGADMPFAGSAPTA
jgi:hypothetical protein